MEFSVAPRDPLTAADQLVLARTIARQVAHAHGLRASFAKFDTTQSPSAVKVCALYRNADLSN